MSAIQKAPPMFLCGGDPFWDDEGVADVVAMVTCADCGWSGFAGGPEPGEIEEAAEAQAQGEWWPDPTFQYEANHTELACRTYRKDRRDRELPPRRKTSDAGSKLTRRPAQARRAYRRAHEAHPHAPLRREGDGVEVCTRCGFAP